MCSNDCLTPSTAGDNPSIEINVRSSSNETEFCGLCGSRAGQLLGPDGTIYDRNDMAQRERFTQRYTVDARDQILRPQRRVCGKYIVHVISNYPPAIKKQLLSI